MDWFSAIFLIVIACGLLCAGAALIAMSYQILRETDIWVERFAALVLSCMGITLFLLMSLIVAGLFGVPVSLGAG